MIGNIVDSPTRVVGHILKQAAIKFTLTAVDDALQNHPDYPSLLSIADVLKNNYKMEVAALSVANEKLNAIPLPFITLLNEPDKPFVAVTAIHNDTVEYTDKKRNTVIKPKDSFLQLWNNNILIAEKTTKSTEENFQQNRLKENIDKLKVPAVLLTGLLSIAGILITNKGLQGNMHAWLAIAGILLFGGVLVSSLLLWYEIDKYNPVLQNICTGIAKTNCEAVLSSKASKVLGKLSWSEVGFFILAVVYYTFWLRGIRMCKILTLFYFG